MRPTYSQPLYQIIAQSLDAAIRCSKSTTTVMDGDKDVTTEHWRDMERTHRERIDDLVYKYLPSGSGWDSGTKFDHDRSTPDRLVFYGDYHHMNQNGYYNGYTQHDIFVKASLTGDIDLRITGRDRNEIKEYIVEIFACALRQDVPK